MVCNRHKSQREGDDASKLADRQMHCWNAKHKIRRKNLRWRAPDCSFTKLIEWQLPESWLYPVTAMHTWNHSACNSSSCAWCTCAAQAHNSKSITLPVKRPSVTSIGFVITQSSPPLYTLFHTLSATLLTGSRRTATTVAVATMPAATWEAAHGHCTTPSIAQACW